MMERGWFVYSVITELLRKPATNVSKNTSYSQVDCLKSVWRMTDRTSDRAHNTVLNTVLGAR